MAEPIEVAIEPLQGPVASYETAVSCLSRLSTQNGGAGPIPTLKETDRSGKIIPISDLVILAAEFGLKAQSVQTDWQGLKAAVLEYPVLVVRNNADVVMVTGGGRSGTEEVSVWDPHHDGVVFFVAREEFERAWNGQALMVTPEQADTTGFKLRSNIKTEPDTTANTSSAPDLAQQQAPSRPMRGARASQSSRHTAPWLRSSGLLLGLSATTIVAVVGIGSLLLMPSGAHRLDDPGVPSPVKPAGVAEASVSGGEAAPAVADGQGTTSVVPTAEPASTSAIPPLRATESRQDDASLLGAPPRKASSLSPVETAPSVVAAPGVQMPQTPVSVTTPVPAEPVTPGPVQPEPDVTALLAHGDTLLRQGDLAAARLFYERAADAGNGRAAVRLGETFDPVFLDHAQLRGARSDIGRATFWYRRAHDLGAPEAEVLLEALEKR
jgi:hypothetical protein